MTLDIMLLRAVIEEFGTYEEYVSFLRKSSDCELCEHFRDCDSQCGRNIYQEHIQGVNKMRKEDAPTKAELWEQIVKLTDICIDKAWQSGFDAGVRSATEISLEELDDEEEMWG